MLKNHVHVTALVPLDLNQSLQSVCYQSRVIDGVDYAETVATILELGIAEYSRLRRFYKDKVIDRV